MQGWVEVEERKEKNTMVLKGKHCEESLRSQQSAIPTLAPSETWGQFLPLLWP